MKPRTLVLTCLVSQFCFASHLIAFEDAPKIQYPLLESSIAEAVALGESPGQKSPGLSFGTPSESSSGMREDSNRTNNFMESTGGGPQTTGFGVEAFTPFTWVARSARDAKKKGTPLKPADLPDEMTEPLFRVIGYADVPTYPIVGVHGSRVEEIFLQSTQKKDEPLPPSTTKRYSDLVRTDSGEILDMGALMAAFTLEELASVANRDKKGEFFVVIVSDQGKEKRFKVKTKHFKKLP